MVNRAPGLIVRVAEPFLDLAPGFIDPALCFVACLFEIALQLLTALARLLPGPVLILMGTSTEHGGQRENYQ